MDNSGVNTMILVIILAVVIFGVAWFFKGELQSEDASIELSLPTGVRSEQE